MVRCVLRISPVDLARAPDLLGMNFDTNREDFDLLDMAQSDNLPLSEALPLTRDALT